MLWFNGNEHLELVLSSFMKTFQNDQKSNFSNQVFKVSGATFSNCNTLMSNVRYEAYIIRP